MSEDSRREVRTGLDRCLARLWRYALVLTGRSDTAEDLVQATCLRAVERADQFVPGTRLDRWLFEILRSIWLNETRARRTSEGGGFIDAEDRLRAGGEKAVETNIPTAEMFKAIGPLPGAERETILLVYGEGYSYAEAASTLGIPIDTVVSCLVAARSTLVTPSPASPTTSRCRYGNPSQKSHELPRSAPQIWCS
jgi:RNA polymerase sigma-70 factor, ECF subfamily